MTEKRITNKNLLEAINGKWGDLSQRIKENREELSQEIKENREEIKALRGDVIGMDKRIDGNTNNIKWIIGIGSVIIGGFRVFIE